MSRVIVHIEKPWPSARASLVVAPVVAGGVDGVFGEDFSGCAVHDGDGGGVDEDDDGFFGVGFADAQVVEFAGSAQGEFAELVDGVEADAVVGVGGLPVGDGLDGGAVNRTGFRSDLARIAYVCFIIDVFSRMIIGWRCASYMCTQMVLDAIEMARWGRGT